MKRSIDSGKATEPLKCTALCTLANKTICEACSKLEYTKCDCNKCICISNRFSVVASSGNVLEKECEYTGHYRNFDYFESDPI